MEEKYCPICANIAGLRLMKGRIEYWQCSNCKTLFCDELDNSNMVGGGNEQSRNIEQNHERIKRIDELSKGWRKDEVCILDYGCGSGMLVEDLKKAGYINTFGFDLYNEKYRRLPDKNSFHIITAIEVIEHIATPFTEVDVMYRSIVPGGVVMIETSFVDVAMEDGIELDDFFYIEPKVGHSTIFSYHGLDLLFALKGFQIRQAFNRNVHLYNRPKK